MNTETRRVSTKNKSLLITWSRSAGATLMTLVLLVVSLPLSVGAQVRVLEDTVALINVTVIDGNGGPPKPNQTVLIENGRITDLFSTGKRPLPNGVKILDLTGQFVIPGLIDSHVHLTAGPRTRIELEDSLRSAFLGGLTSVRDMGGDGFVLAELSRTSADPSVSSPRIYFSSIMAGPTWFSDPRAKASAHGQIPGEQSWLRSVNSETNIPKVIAEAKASGATGIKMYADLPPDLIKKLTDEAHRQGLRVWSHATIFPSRPEDALLAGVDVLSHSALLAYEGMSQVPESYQANRNTVVNYEGIPTDSEVLTKFLTGMRKRGAILDATLFVIGQIAQSTSTPSKAQEARLSWTYAITKRAHELGVTIAAGTDGMGRGSLPNIHREMELLVSKCGLTPLQAITAATRNGAQALGIDKTSGTIEKGKVADLVVLSADPSVDIRNTQQIVYIVKTGRIQRRDQGSDLLSLILNKIELTTLWCDQPWNSATEQDAE